MHTQLLCSFTKRNQLHDTIDLIIDYHEILFNKIYVFQNEDNFHQLICTYNIEQDTENYLTNKDTISLHRKKQSNTLYTINALNEVIRRKNNGVLDKTFPIDWDEFRNNLLLTNSSGFVKIPTRIYTIINVTEWESKEN